MKQRALGWSKLTASPGSSGHSSQPAVETLQARRGDAWGQSSWKAVHIHSVQNGEHGIELNVVDSSSVVSKSATALLPCPVNTLCARVHIICTPHYAH